MYQIKNCKKFIILKLPIRVIFLPDTFLSKRLMELQIVSIEKVKKWCIQSKLYNTLYAKHKSSALFKGVHGTEILKLLEVPEVSLSVRNIKLKYFAFYFGLRQISAEDLFSKLRNLSSLCYQTLGQVWQWRAKVW